MPAIFLWMFIGVGGIVLIVIGAYFYSAKCIEIFYTRDKEDLDYILQTQCVPARWCRRYVRRTERLQAAGADAARIERVRARANGVYMRRLNRVEAFAKSATVYQYNQTAKNAMLGDLTNIRQQWERREYLHEPY